MERAGGFPLESQYFGSTRPFADCLHAANRSEGLHLAGSGFLQLKQNRLEPASHFCSTKD